MDEKKLKPCPFCGGIPSVTDEIPSRLYAKDTAFCVYCPSCQLLFGFDFDYGGQFAAPEEAVKAWNARNTRTLTPAQEHAEELYKGLKTVLDIVGDVCESVAPMFKSLTFDNAKDEFKHLAALLDKME